MQRQSLTPTISATSDDVSRETSPETTRKWSHWVRIEHDEAHLVTYVNLDGLAWGYLGDQALQHLNDSGKRLWAETVIRELLELIRAGKDPWSDEAMRGRHDFLMRCLP